MPAGSREQVADAAREGFLAGFNDISILGAVLAFAAAIGAFWLVRERDIERGELVEEVEPEIVEHAPAALPEPVAASLDATAALRGRRTVRRGRA